ncbi:molybdopterin-guanine dinucleotide biosynthesis protein MobA [Neolewinella aurantiaca]|uniref:Molybdopterin-guanine dinucleotide biosynthesis protein MobA n=2 Tax=Neolewinella aurantiaca TaxID=2602767 RepID=A0A5C7FUW9_9BACT|nr:molybdopterin-guanine dinucleotide biosynthesis protein MobA [Neolewinella aurantiaca]
MDKLIVEWAEKLQPDHNTLTVIGDHADPLAGKLFQTGNKRFGTPAEGWNEYDERLQRGHYDCALVNGNHYPAAHQIVFVDEQKASTLERRQEQLTDVSAIVMVDEARQQVPAWLEEQLADRPAPLVCTLSEAENMVLPLLLNLLGTRVPALKTLILTGGKSERMGERKADLVYRSDGQTEAERLASICDELLPGSVHISVAEPGQEPVGNFPNLADRFPGLGAAGAIATAFLTDPNAAWLVLACDLPLLEKEQISALIEARASGKLATAYQLSSQRFPEPLVAIYEPKAYPRLLQFLAMGYACPRKVLINSDVKELVVENEAPFTNANTKEEREKVLSLLQ